MKESEASFFWDITRLIPEYLSLEQNRCEDLEPHEATEHCVGVRIFIFVMLGSNLDRETVCSDQDIHKFPRSLQPNAGNSMFIVALLFPSVSFPIYYSLKFLLFSCIC